MDANTLIEGLLKLVRLPRSWQRNGGRILMAQASQDVQTLTEVLAVFEGLVVDSKQAAFYVEIAADLRTLKRANGYLETHECPALFELSDAIDSQKAIAV